MVMMVHVYDELIIFSAMCQIPLLSSSPVTLTETSLGVDEMTYALEMRNCGLRGA